MKKNIKTIILIDGSYHLYRSYYSFTHSKYGNKKSNGVIYGTLSIIKKLFIKYKPTHLAIIFDSKGKTFRHKLFKEYKNNRRRMPLDLICQISPLYEKLKYVGISPFFIKGVEADDIIGTLALLAEKDGYKVLISTGDKDMAQLVSNQVKIIDTISKKELGPEEIKYKFGILPKYIIDYLALKGDISDNIPGVPGIGEKTAINIIDKLGGIKNIYQFINKKIYPISFSEKIIDKFKKYQKRILLSYQLASIQTNLNLDFSYRKISVKNLNLKKLEQIIYENKD